MKDLQARRPDRPVKLEQKERLVLHLIHTGLNSSRLELAREADLSPASITSIVQRLITKGLVIESEPTRSNLGRRPVPLEIRRDAAYLIGLDLGSIYLRIVITDINGNIIHKYRTQTGMGEGRKRVWEKAFHSINEAIKGSSLSPDAIRGIGIAHSGVIDSDKGLVVSYPRPGQMAEWKNIPLRQIFQDEFKV